MKTKVYQVKNFEEAIALASQEFGISEDELIEKIVSENDEYQEIEITVCIDPVEKGRRYIQTILDNNGVEGTVCGQLLRNTQKICGRMPEQGYECNTRNRSCRCASGKEEVS